MDWVQHLEHISDADSSVVGDKAAALAQFYQLSQQLQQRVAGHPSAASYSHWSVPTGFVISMDAHRQHFEDAATGPITHELQRPRLHFDLLRQTLAAFDQLFKDNPAAPGQPAYVTVRRSEMGTGPSVQVNGRNSAHSPTSSHGTYYFVTRDRLAETIIDCWMSPLRPGANPGAAMNTPAISHASEIKPMAVIVMRMVNAACSGTARSEEPSGDYPEHSLVEASWGLGATAVDGRVQTDQFFVSQSGPRQVNQQRLALKQLYMPGDLANPELARLETVPQPKQQRPALDPKQVLAVDALSQLVAAVWQCPVEIEWAYQEQTLYLLQAKPQPEVSQAPSAAPTINKKGAWLLAQPLIDGSRAALTPLSVDLYQRLLPGYVTFVQGRAYVKLSRLRRWLPFAGTDSEFCQPLILPEDNLLLGRLGGWRLLRSSLRMAVSYLSRGIFGHRVVKLNEAQVHRFRHQLHQLAGKSNDALQLLTQAALGSHPLHAIYQYPLQLEAFCHRRQIYVSLLHRLLTQQNPELEAEKLDAFCREVLDDHNALQSDIDELAALVSEHPGLVSLPGAALATRLQEIPDGHPLALALQSFQRRHGHRFTGYLELATPRWREAPQAWFATLLPRIRQSQSKEQRPESLQARLPPELLNAEPEADLSLDYRLRLLLPNPGLRWLGERLVRRARHYGALQDAARQQTVSLLDLVREQLCSMERQLIHRGKLHCSGDLFYLQWPELSALQAGTKQWAELEHKVRRRRQRHRQWNRETPVMSFNLDLAPPVLRDTTDPDTLPPKLTETVPVAHA